MATNPVYPAVFMSAGLVVVAVGARCPVCGRRGPWAPLVTFMGCQRVACLSDKHGWHNFIVLDVYRSSVRRWGQVPDGLVLRFNDERAREDELVFNLAEPASTQRWVAVTAAQSMATMH